MKDQGFPLLSTSGGDRKLTGLFDAIDNCHIIQKDVSARWEAHLRASLD